MTRIYRFLGDPRGYRVDGQGRTGWVDAHIGRTDRAVRINVDQAYVVEQYGPGQWMLDEIGLGSVGPAAISPQ